MIKNDIYKYKQNVAQRKYRITTDLKVETDIIVSMAASLIGCAVIPVLSYVKTFKLDVIVFIGNMIICLTSHWAITFSIMVSPLILKISFCDIKGKMYKLPIIPYKETLIMSYDLVKDRFYYEFNCCFKLNNVPFLSDTSRPHI